MIPSVINLKWAILNDLKLALNFQQLLVAKLKYFSIKLKLISISLNMPWESLFKSTFKASIGVTEPNMFAEKS